jgi:hypothetical protein
VNRESKTLWLLAAGVVVAWWWFGPDEEGGILGNVRQLVDAGVDLVTRGARLTNAPYNTSTGVVPGAPQDLADSTSYDLETYSLARAISSEEGRSDDGTKLAVGWAIKNRADAGSGSITSLVTHATESTHSGYYGTQRNIDANTAGYNHSDRYCSTANDPYDGDAQIAYAIQTGTLPDPTGGAQYFDRSADDDNADQVAANRAASGLIAYDVPSASSGLRFWGPA